MTPDTTEKDARTMLDRVAREGAWKEDDLNYILGLEARGIRSIQNEMKYLLGLPCDY